MRQIVPFQATSEIPACPGRMFTTSQRQSQVPTRSRCSVRYLSPPTHRPASRQVFVSAINMEVRHVRLLVSLVHCQPGRCLNGVGVAGSNGSSRRCIVAGYNGRQWQRSKSVASQKHCKICGCNFNWSAHAAAEFSISISWWLSHLLCGQSVL